MADVMQFDLVSPERSLASLQASAVQIPATEGDMTVMPNHAPTITTLRPGIVKVESPDGAAEYLVTGGFAEISQAGVSVLAEKALPVAEAKKADLDELVAKARGQYEAAVANDNLVDEFAKLLADMEALGTHMSIGG
ncbi:MAG: F0F1 ATP synthase subunit epsilon [Rhodobacteraceae bacterium]|nr:F0F1 ATP synthase subunit epsilon [Paracoccaceae bacterium]